MAELQVSKVILSTYHFCLQISQKKLWFVGVNLEVLTPSQVKALSQRRQLITFNDDALYRFRGFSLHRRRCRSHIINQRDKMTTTLVASSLPNVDLSSLRLLSPPQPCFLPRSLNELVMLYLGRLQVFLSSEGVLHQLIQHVFG